MIAWNRFVRYCNWITIQKTIAGVVQNRLTGLAAEMAFHAMLGLFPGIIAILTAISLFEESVESIFISLAIHFADIIPIEVWTLLLEFIESIRSAESTSWFSLSSIVAIWIISGVLSAAINALDQIHQVPTLNRRSYLQTKVVAISLTILTISLLIIACFLLWVSDFLLEIVLQQSWDSLLLGTWGIFSVILIMAIVSTSAGLIYYIKTKLSRKNQQELKSYIIVLVIILAAVAIQIVYTCYLSLENLLLDSNIGKSLIDVALDLWRLFGFPIALGIVAIAFALIYRHGASERIKNTPIFPGAILAAISWAIVSVIFRLYVTYIGIYSKIYGAVGTVVVLMLWLYLSSLVMLIGEQVNVIIGEAIKQEKLGINPQVGIDN